VSGNASDRRTQQETARQRRHTERTAMLQDFAGPAHLALAYAAMLCDIDAAGNSFLLTWLVFNVR
jgi:hypothetical protein